MARRSGVEHDAAAQRRLGPENDAVAARRDEGRGEPQLREAAPARDDPRRHRRGAVVDVQPRAVRIGRELLERDVEAVARG